MGHAWVICIPNLVETRAATARRRRASRQRRSRSLPARCPRVRSQLTPEAVARDAQDSRGLRVGPPASIEDPQNMVLLHLAEGRERSRCARGGLRWLPAGGSLQFVRKVFGVHLRSPGEGGAMLDRVLKLADIAGPNAVEKHLPGRGGEAAGPGLFSRLRPSAALPAGGGAGLSGLERQHHPVGQI